MIVLLTGGAGYIGSHTAVELLEAGHQVVIVDNLSNSSEEAVRRVTQITKKPVIFYQADLRDRKKLDEIFTNHQTETVIHFAGLKAVGESVAQPLNYYDNNLGTSIVLLETMQAHQVNKLIFSSSATVYGNPESLPLTEDSRTGIGITNPYGQTKFMIEQIIQDTAKANPNLQATILRYFNPVGAHSSGLIGEDPNGPPNNLMPYVAQVAIGKLDKVGVFGDNYDTPDGTGVRDYIHVVDLAKGHLAAIGQLKPGVEIFNLGTGKGVSVIELISAFSKAAGHDIAYEVKPRRAGDLPNLYADPQKAEKELNWRANYDIEQACQDSWNWQSKNPDGFATSEEETDGI